jgi:hypothetical protein
MNIRGRLDSETQDTAADDHYCTAQPAVMNREEEKRRLFHFAYAE